MYIPAGSVYSDRLTAESYAAILEKLKENEIEKKKFFLINQIIIKATDMNEA